MTNDTYHHNQPALPPPLPDDVDSDDLATVPATSPWQMVPEKGADDGTEPAGYQVAPPASAPPQEAYSTETTAATDDAPSIASIAPQHRDSRWMSRKAILGLLAASVTMITAVGVLIIIRWREARGTDPSEVTVTLIEPKIIENDTTKSALKSKKADIDAMFEEIAATKGPLIIGKHQPVDELSSHILSAQTPFAKTVRAALESKISPLNKAQFEQTENLWQLGVTVLDVATEALEEMTDLGQAADEGETAETAKILKAWLIEWLLGKNGLYCELRDQFWNQGKTVRASQKSHITQMRQERKKFAKAFDYPTTPLFKYCERN